MIRYKEGAKTLIVTIYVPGDAGGPFVGPLYASAELARAAHPSARIWEDQIETRSLGEALGLLAGVEFEDPESSTMAYSTVLTRLCV